MSRKYPAVSKRKQDLSSKLNELKTEGDSILKYVKNMIDQGIAITRDLETETDNKIFIQRYPVVVKKLDSLLNTLVQVNCNIELCASDDEVEGNVQNHVTKQTSSCNEATVNDYEILTPGNPSELSATCNDNPDIHNSSFYTKSAHSSTSINAPLWAVQEGEILDMCYLDGSSPFSFWLCYYKTKSLDYLKETMLTRYHNKELHPYDTSLLGICTYVCAFDGNDCFRGKILDVHLGQPVRFTVLDVDSGRIHAIDQVKVFRLDKDLAEIPVQALNCCLHGDLGDRLLWNDQVIPLFCKVLAESELVVTVCGKVEHDVPKFLVEIDCHNDNRINRKIELNRWIILSVFPKLKEIKEKSKGDEILKSLYTYLDPVITDKEEATEQSIHSRSSSLADISMPSNQIPNLTLQCSTTFIMDQNQLHNLGQGEPSSLSQMKKTSPLKHVELSPHHSLKIQPVASTEDLNLSMNTKCTLPEFNRNSPSRTWLDEGERSYVNCSTVSTLYYTPASSSVRSAITTETLPDEKHISSHHSALVYSAGQTYETMLAHIEDPGEFYIHILCEDNVKIDKLRSEMNQYYNGSKIVFKSKKVAKCIGSFCAAFYDADEHWYRAQIVDWNKDDDNDPVSIKYVDYGNHSSVHFSMLQPLRAEFAELPICARQCHLAMIHPHTSIQDKVSESWSCDAADEFKKLVNMQSLYTVVLMESSEDSVCSLPVILQDCQNDGCIINKRLVELGYAVTFSPVDFSLYVVQRNEQEVLSAPQDQNKQNLKDDKDSHEGYLCTEQLVPVLDLSNHMDNNVMNDWDPMSEDYFSETNNLYHDDEDACYAVTGYKPQDEKRLCKFYAQGRRCFKGETCLKEHSYPHPDGWTTDKECMFTDAFSKLVLPDVQDEILLQVTCITKVNMFYAVICDGCPSSSDKVHIRRIDVEGEESEEETLLTLNNFLNEERNVKALKRCAVTPALGQIVAARFSKDGRFYRARVVDYSDGKVNVFYVDFGNKEWVNESDVRNIERKYLHLPFQATDCVLANVDDVSESMEAKNFFENLVYNKTLHARVIAQLRHLSRLEVLLWDENGCDVGACIIQRNYGKERIYSI